MKHNEVSNQSFCTEMQKYLVMILESSDKSDLACLMIIIFGLPLWLT